MKNRKSNIFWSQLTINSFFKKAQSRLSWIFLGSFLAAVSCSNPNPSNRDSKKSKAPNVALYDTISQLDKNLFSAFNHQNLKEFKKYFDIKLEVFQDVKGVRNYEQSMATFTELFQAMPDLKRKLKKGSLEVYPIEGFGAIEIGQHAFIHTEEAENQGKIVHFIHIWKRSHGQWKITKIITYSP